MSDFFKRLQQLYGQAQSTFDSTLDAIGIPHPAAPTAQQQAKQTADQAKLKKAVKQKYWQVIGQVPEGLISTTVANSARPNETGAAVAGYRPAIVDALPAFAGTVKDLASATGLIKPTAKGSFLRNSQERMNTADERTRKALGVQEPHNAAETALNIGGSLIVPGGDLSALAKTGKAGKALKAAAEIAVPLRQGSFSSAVKTVVPVGVGLREGVDAIANDPSYHGAADYFRSQPVDGGQDNQQDQSQVDEFGFPTGQTTDEFGFPTQEIQDEQDKHNNWEMAGAVLGAAALGLGGIAVAKSIAHTAPFQEIGHAVEKSATLKGAKGKVTKAVTTALDSQAAARSAADLALTPAAAKKLKWESDRITNTAIGTQIRGFLETGKAPLTAKKYTSPAHVGETIAATLSPQEKQVIDRALIFASSMDDYKRTGVNASFSHVSPQEKQAAIDFVVNDPKLAPHFKAVQQVYKDLQSYYVDTGRRSVADSVKFMQENPNYVPLRADASKDFSISGHKGGAQDYMRGELERNVLDDRAGLQENARSPIDQMMNSWQDAIWFARTNDYRKMYLDALANSGAKAADGKAPLVRALPLGESPKSKTWDKIHTVFEGGQPQHYQVNDPALEASLNLKGRGGVAAAEHARSIMQSTITGPLGSIFTGFQFVTSPFLESTAGMLLRGSALKTGVVNEALSKAGKSIGPLDLTTLITPFTGASRYLYNETNRVLATKLTHALLKDDSPLQAILSGKTTEMAAAILGPQRTQALIDRLSMAYENSINSIGNEIGAFSHNLRGSPDSLTPFEGIADVAPNLYLQQGVNKYKQLIANGDYMRGALAASKVPFIAARASGIGQMISMVTDAMRNGFTYSNIATNLKNMDEAQLASEVRRAAVDNSVHGTSQTISGTIGMIPWANVGLQTFYQMGRRAAENPAAFAMNAGALFTGLAALKLASMTDPEVVQRNHDKTPEQRASHISLPAGMELPIEQSARIVWGPLSELLDHITGADTGMYNDNLVDAIGNWLDHPDDEAGHQEFQEAERRSLSSALKAANPLVPSSSPLYRAMQVGEGIDPEKTELQGRPVAIEGQQYSGVDTNRRFEGSLMTAQQEAMLQSIFGSFAQHLIDIADEIHRANGKYSNTSPRTAWNIAKEQWRDSMIKSASVDRPLFGQYESLRSVADPDFTLTVNKQKGIDAASNLYNKNVRLDNVQPISDPVFQEYMDETPLQIKQQYIGTPAQTVGVYTQMLSKQLRPIQQQVNEIQKVIDRTNANVNMTKEARNHAINDLNDRRRALYYQKLTAIRFTEDEIAAALGQDHFDYQDFDPDKYAQ